MWPPRRERRGGPDENVLIALCWGGGEAAPALNPRRPVEYCMAGEAMPPPKPFAGYWTRVVHPAG